MLDQLIESRARTRRSGTQVAISVVAHTAVIGVAVFATAHAHSKAPEDKPTRVVFPRTYLVPKPTHVSTATPIPHTGRFPSIWIDPAIVLPAPVVATAATGGTVDLSEFRKDPLFALGSGPGTGSPRSLGEPFRDDQVETTAGLAPGNAPPDYPEQLRTNGIEGKVIATFIIDTTGKAEAASIRFATDGNALFEASVRSALSRMRFYPAQIGGAKVRQIVQMPFVFTINRQSAIR
jgi:protein TonB